MKLSGFVITEDNKKIAYNHYKNNMRNIVIIVHGFYNSKDAVLLEKLAQHLFVNYDVLLFDLRGHGGSSGFFTWTSKEGLDVKAILNYLNVY